MKVFSTIFLGILVSNLSQAWALDESYNVDEVSDSQPACCDNNDDPKLLEADIPNSSGEPSGYCRVQVCQLNISSVCEGKREWTVLLWGPLSCGRFKR